MTQPTTPLVLYRVRRITPRTNHPDLVNLHLRKLDDQPDWAPDYIKYTADATSPVVETGRVFGLPLTESDNK